MNIIIPMAGAGSRFTKAGYKTHKPAILTTDIKTGEKLPMVILAAKALPCIDNAKKLLFIDRDIHKTDGVEEKIIQFFPKAKFITINYLTEGQASTCLLAKDDIDNKEELLIAGCDNGMVYDINKFNEIKKTCNAIVFTYRNNESVLANPSAYGWCVVDADDNIIKMSVKKQISNNPINDHAVVATFWYEHGHDFVRSAKKMITENDRVNGEFYIDQVIEHSIALGLKVKVFEIDRYICWGTPEDYENYEKCISYWKNFIIIEQNRLRREI